MMFSGLSIFNRQVNRSSKERSEERGKERGKDNDDASFSLVSSWRGRPHNCKESPDVIDWRIFEDPDSFTIKPRELSARFLSDLNGRVKSNLSSIELLDSGISLDLAPLFKDIYATDPDFIPWQKPLLEIISPVTIRRSCTISMDDYLQAAEMVALDPVMVPKMLTKRLTNRQGLVSFIFSFDYINNDYTMMMPLAHSMILMGTVRRVDIGVTTLDARLSSSSQLSLIPTCLYV